MGRKTDQKPPKNKPVPSRAAIQRLIDLVPTAYGYGIGVALDPRGGDCWERWRNSTVRQRLHDAMAELGIPVERINKSERSATKRKVKK